MFLLKWLLLLHPFYVSLTEVNYNAKAATLEISVRTFTTDLEATLRKNYPAAKIDLLSKAVDKQTADDRLIARYEMNHLHLEVDGKVYGLTFVGREIKEENTWSYYEIDSVPAFKKLHLTNTLLYDLQPQQSNMHVVKYNGQEKTFKLNNPDSEVDFSF